MNNGNQPAFPYTFEPVNMAPEYNEGLTKRELFAVIALNGEMAGRDWNMDDLQVAKAARIAVACADALLAELEKVKP